MTKPARWGGRAGPASSPSRGGPDTGQFVQSIPDHQPLVTRKVALVTRAPKQRSLQKVEGRAWTAEEPRQFLHTAAGHRFFPVLWLTAITGVRRNEVLGLKWPDIDFKKKRIALNRGLIAVDYELHQTRDGVFGPHRHVGVRPWGAG